ncbi:MAG TPA: ABC transporter ATP-binding protein [Anaerolineae bacterium]|nr:ABC transporter ATP-binding protein [Anaerolineae bacterium]
MKMEMSDNWVINTHSLSKSYKDVEALKSLDLKVAKNSIFGFLGPNGAGKTTTIKLLLGLIRPTSGGGSVFGHDILRDNVEIRKRIGYLAQNPSYYKHMTARETLRFRARFFYTGPKDALENRIAETLEMAGLTNKADRPIKGFSGGELQRLGIAQAQVNHPDLLILDEPAANLDPGGRRDVLEVMERLRKYTTIFYSTHILDDVQQVSDTVAILNHGELVAQAPMEELLAGNDGTIYTVVMEGDPSGAQARVTRREWVSSIDTTSMNGRITWRVHVTDEEVAKSDLLRLILADEDIKVIEFGRKQYELEEVFLRIVEGEENVQY